MVFLVAYLSFLITMKVMDSVGFSVKIVAVIPNTFAIGSYATFAWKELLLLML